MPHTPGPWEAEHVSDALRVISQGRSKVIARLEPLQFPEAETFNNARLIAAAPDLLAACRLVKEFLAALEAGTVPGDPLRKIRELIHNPLHSVLDPAIAKAEGRARCEKFDRGRLPEQ